jgi:hypothetical protein
LVTFETERGKVAPAKWEKNAEAPGGRGRQARRRTLAKGTGICKTAKLAGLGTGTVHKLKRQMRAVN